MKNNCFDCPYINNENLGCLLPDGQKFPVDEHEANRDYLMEAIGIATGIFDIIPERQHVKAIFDVVVDSQRGDEYLYVGIASLENKVNLLD